MIAYISIKASINWINKNIEQWLEKVNEVWYNPLWVFSGVGGVGGQNALKGINGKKKSSQRVDQKISQEEDEERKRVGISQG